MLDISHRVLTTLSMFMSYEYERSSALKPHTPKATFCCRPLLALLSVRRGRSRSRSRSRSRWLSRGRGGGGRRSMIANCLREGRSGLVAWLTPRLIALVALPGTSRYARAVCRIFVSSTSTTSQYKVWRKVSVGRRSICIHRRMRKDVQVVQLPCLMPPSSKSLALLSSPRSLLPTLAVFGNGNRADMDSVGTKLPLSRRHPDILTSIQGPVGHDRLALKAQQLAGTTALPRSRLQGLVSQWEPFLSEVRTLLPPPDRQFALTIMPCRKT